MKGWPHSEAPAKRSTAFLTDAHAANCDGPDDWHQPTTGHCADCGCIACTLATTR